jgi:hypothetical protein
MADREPAASPRRFDIIDGARGLITLGGIGLVGYGAWLHYPPLGFVAAGALLAAVGIVATLRVR